MAASTRKKSIGLLFKKETESWLFSISIRFQFQTWSLEESSFLSTFKLFAEYFWGLIATYVPESRTKNWKLETENWKTRDDKQLFITVTHILFIEWHFLQLPSLNLVIRGVRNGASLVARVRVPATANCGTASATAGAKRDLVFKPPLMR